MSAQHPAIAREIEISDWKPFTKNTMRGSFTIRTPSGFIFHKVVLHEKNDKRWIQFPSEKWTDTQGETHFTTLFELCDRSTSDRFRDQVLAALDQFFANAGVN